MDRTRDQANGPAVFALEVFGVAISVAVVGPPELAVCVRESLTVARREWQVEAEDAEFGIYSDPGNGYRVTGPEGDSNAAELTEALEELRGRLVDHVASCAQEHLFVRGSAVTMGGQAIVLAGEPAAGTPALLDALVGAGASLYAHGYVPIDDAGQVHPQPLRAKTSDSSALVDIGIPVPIGVVATLTRRPGDSVFIREELSETGMLALLKAARGSDERPEFSLAVAREAIGQARVLHGQWDRPEEAAAVLIERLARVPRRVPARTEPPAASQFVSLVLELEAQLTGLAETLSRAGVEAVLLNGDEARPALAHGFALSYSALVEVPRSQVPRALGAIELAGWRPVPHAGARHYFRQGVIVEVRARSRAARMVRTRRRSPGSIRMGRYGLPEPESRMTAYKRESSLAPQPFDPGPGPLRIGAVADAVGLAAEGLSLLDTLRLRTREREFRGQAVQYGPGVHAFEETLEALVDEVLARLPGDGARPRVVDMGTGSGTLALSIARERPDALVLATDVSLRALGWARRNRRRLGARNVSLAQGSLLAPVPSRWRRRVAAIVTNPPMALPAHAVELRARPDWPVGTATGPAADGLGLVRALALQARDVLAPGGYLHIQMLGHQGPWIERYLAELGYESELPTTGSFISVAARWPGVAARSSAEPNSPSCVKPDQPPAI